MGDYRSKPMSRGHKAVLGSHGVISSTRSGANDVLGDIVQDYRPGTAGKSSKTVDERHCLPKRTFVINEDNHQHKLPYKHGHKTRGSHKSQGEASFYMAGTPKSVSSRHDDDDPHKFGSEYSDRPEEVNYSDLEQTPEDY